MHGDRFGIAIQVSREAQLRVGSISGVKLAAEFSVQPLAIFGASHPCVELPVYFFGPRRSLDPASHNA